MIREKMFMPAYAIKTHRLLIKCYDPRDAFLLKEAIDESRDHLSPWMSWAKYEPEELDKKIQRIREYRANFDLDENYGYGIFLPDRSRIIGSTALKTTISEDVREIGYWMHKDFVNKGYATEVASALTKVAFEINKVNIVEIHCDIKNVRSSAIPKKLGFNREAVIRKNEKDDNGERKQEEIWVLFKEEYKKTSLINYEVEAFDVIDRKIL